MGALPKGGRPVTGERLVGREMEIERVMRDFLFDQDGNNMALYGLPRIGKTSIAKEVIRRYLADVNKQDNIFPLYLDLNPVKGWSVAQIYFFILHGIWEELEAREVGEGILSYLKEPLAEIKTKSSRREC